MTLICTYKNYIDKFQEFWQKIQLPCTFLMKIWSLYIPGLNGAQTRALEKDEPEWHVRHLKYSNYCPNQVILELGLDHRIFHVGNNMGCFLGYISWKKKKLFSKLIWSGAFIMQLPSHYISYSYIFIANKISFCNFDFDFSSHMGFSKLICIL